MQVARHGLKKGSSSVRCSHLVKPRFPEQFVYLVLDIRDASDQNLITIFPQFAPPTLCTVNDADDRNQG